MKWVDGRVFETSLEIERYKRMDIYPSKYIYLNAVNSECNDEESFYECFGSYVLRRKFDQCNNNCFSMSLPPKLGTNITKSCKRWEELKCFKNKAWVYFS